MTKKYFQVWSSAALAALAAGTFAGCSPEGGVPAGGAQPPAAESRAAARAPLAVVQEAGTIAVSGADFSAKFSEETGTLAELVYGGKNLIAYGNGPRLNAFRAIVNNDGWVYRKWFQDGLFDLKHEVVGSPVVIRSDDGTVTISVRVRSQGKFSGTLKGDPMFQYGNVINGIPVEITPGRELGEDDLAFTTQQVWTIYPDGSIELAANITSNKPETDLPRLGYTMDVPAEYSLFTYYGRGPQENHKDRKSGSFIGIYSAPVAEQIEAYAKPQETGNREDVRWCALRDGQGAGALFIAREGSFAAQALPVTAADLLFAPNTYKLKEKIANSRATTLNLDAGVRGLGGASCGPDTENRDKVFAVPTDFGFIIRSVRAETDLRAAANVSPAGAAPISVTRDVAGVVHVASKDASEKILVSVNGAPAQEYSGTIPLRDGGSVSAWYADRPGVKTEITFPKIEKVRPAVLFASSQNSGQESAANMTDGDPSTIWHTAYSVTQADYPHWVDFDIGELKSLKGVSYLPRQDGSRNGDVRGYEIFVSRDGKDWGKAIAAGEFSEGKAEKRVLFPAPVEARYVRFRALSSQNGQIFASGAEFSALEN